jgi:hypothetical protein
VSQPEDSGDRAKEVVFPSLGIRKESDRTGHINPIAPIESHPPKSVPSIAL